MVDPASINAKYSYMEQRARGVYIATTCQPEAAFDFSIAAKHQNPTQGNFDALNKRISWQIENIDRGLKYISVNLATAKLFVFVDGSFANLEDLSSQLGYEIILANETSGYKDDEFEIEGSLVH